MWKKTLGVFITIGGLGAFVLWGVMTQSDQPISSDDSGDPNSSIVYYYGRECPHCKDIEEFIEKNAIGQKIPIAKKEVWHNPRNRKELEERASSCNLSGENVAVPFVWGDGRCFVGTPDVQAFLGRKIGI